MPMRSVFARVNKARIQKTPVVPLASLILLGFACTSISTSPPQQPSSKQASDETQLVRKTLLEAIGAREGGNYRKLYALLSNRHKKELLDKYRIDDAADYVQFVMKAETEWTKHTILKIIKEDEGKYTALVRSRAHSEGEEVDVVIRYVLVSEGKVWRIDDWEYEEWKVLTDDHQGR